MSLRLGVRAQHDPRNGREPRAQRPRIVRQSDALPRIVLVVSVVCIAVVVTMIFVGAVRVGVTWDEPFHVQRLQHFLQSGWYLGDGQLQDGEPRPDMTQQFVYAPVTMLMFHGILIIFGVDQHGLVSDSATAYAMRHIGVGVLGALGIAAVVALGKALLGRWSWGVFAGALLGTMPLWTGYAMFSVKDIPVATGYTFATLGTWALAGPSVVSRRWARVCAPAVLTFGVVLSVGTRPGVWTGIAASVLIFLMLQALTLLQERTRARLSSVLWRTAGLMVALAAAGTLLWLIYPRVFRLPIPMVLDSVSATTRFRPDPAPWGYIPVHVLLQLPVLSVALVSTGIVVALMSLVRAQFRFGPSDAALLLLLSQLLAMPLGAVLTKASLYGDLRQLLFAAPAAALIAAYGAAAIFQRIGELRNPRGAGRVACIVLVAGLVGPVLVQGFLFPYNYVFHNPLSAIADVTTRGDYQRASGPEIAQKVPRGRVVCSPRRDSDGKVTRGARIDGWLDCGENMSSPIATYMRESRPTPPVPLAPEEFWVLEFEGWGRIPENCEPMAHESRALPWAQVPMVTLARCSYPFPSWTSRPVLFATPNEEAYAFLDQGWYPPETDGSYLGVRSRGDVSALTFRVAPEFRNRALRLRIITEEPVKARFALSGKRLVTMPIHNETGVELFVPKSLVERGLTEPLTLTISPTGPGALDLKLLGLEAKGASS